MRAVALALTLLLAAPALAGATAQEKFAKKSKKYVLLDLEKVYSGKALCLCTDGTSLDDHIASMVASPYWHGNVLGYKVVCHVRLFDTSDGADEPPQHCADFVPLAK